MIKVDKIVWINESAKEAEVLISNGINNINCFSQPFNYSVNDILTQPIYSYEAQGIVRSDEHGFAIEKQGNSFEYFLKGEIINLKEKLVDVGGFIISLEDSYLPGDLINGDVIEFTTSRLDIY